MTEVVSVSLPQEQSLQRIPNRMPTNYMTTSVQPRKSSDNGCGLERKVRNGEQRDHISRRWSKEDTGPD